MRRAVREAMDEAISRIAAYGLRLSDVRITSWAAARLWLRTLTLTPSLTIGDVNAVHLRLAMKARFPSASFDLTIRTASHPVSHPLTVSCAPLVGVSTGTDWQCGSIDLSRKIDLDDNVARVLDYVGSISLAGSIRLAGSISRLDITNCKSPKFLNFLAMISGIYFSEFWTNIISKAQMSISERARKISACQLKIACPLKTAFELNMSLKSHLFRCMSRSTLGCLGNASERRIHSPRFAPPKALWWTGSTRSA